MRPLYDRVLGCIVGGAIGDYVGSPVEGRPGPVDAAVPTHSEITDDTQLTLATCEAIVSSGAADPETIARSFGEWFLQGRITGIGSSTLKALRDITFGAHWALAGASGERSAGNGAAMRIAPLAFCVDPTSPEGRLTVRDVSSVTHRNDEAFAGALAIAIAIAVPGFDFISTLLSELPDSNTRDRLRVLASEAGASVADLGIRYGAGAYVAESVPLALVAASRAGESEFVDAILSVITCGSDADTTGSMVGQIVGSKIGLSGIPRELTQRHFGRERVLEISRDFADFVCRKQADESTRTIRRDDARERK